MSGEKLKIDARRKKIVEIINSEGKVTVEKLSADLKTTPVTIRSDLSALERDGYLERVVGGAIQTSVNYFNREFLSKKQDKSGNKKKIAYAISQIISDGDTIFINSGTTTYFVAIELKKRKNLKIVTNSLTVATELASTPTFNVILLGGEVNIEGSFTYGSDVIEQLERYRANYAILSVDGVCHDAGISTIHADEVLVDRMMVERSRETIVVADSSKLGQEGFLFVCPTENISKIVTDKDANRDFVKKLKDKDVKVIMG